MPMITGLEEGWKRLGNGTFFRTVEVLAQQKSESAMRQLSQLLASAEKYAAAVPDLVERVGIGISAPAYAPFARSLSLIRDAIPAGHFTQPVWGKCLQERAMPRRRPMTEFLPWQVPSYYIRT
jgi:hypothetical protein